MLAKECFNSHSLCSKKHFSVLNSKISDSKVFKKKTIYVCIALWCHSKNFALNKFYF